MATVKLETLATLRGAAFAALLTCACGSQLPAISSGQIGCAEREIVISDEGGTWSTRTWTARCNGKTFYCTSVAGSGDTAGQINCKEASPSTPSGALKPAGAAPSTAPDSSAAPMPATPVAVDGGCKYDTQCKGDRVCERGVCVSPVAPAPPAASAPLAPTTP